MASEGYMPIVHVLNDGDVALGGRRCWCWPFFKQTKYLVQLIAINEIESILVLLLEYFKTGPVNQFRSITKDIIFRGSYVVSSPFKYVKDKYYLFQDHMGMYEEFSVLRDKNLDLDSLKKEVDFYKSENALLKK